MCDRYVSSWAMPLASLRPRPVIARTIFKTAIFFSASTSVSTTSNSQQVPRRDHSHHFYRAGTARMHDRTASAARQTPRTGRRSDSTTEEKANHVTFGVSGTDAHPRRPEVALSGVVACSASAQIITRCRARLTRVSTGSRPNAHPGSARAHRPTPRRQRSGGTARHRPATRGARHPRKAASPIRGPR